HVLLLVGLLVLPRTGLQPAFDVNFSALFQVLARDFSEPLPQDDGMPFGAVLPLAVLVLVAFVCRESQLRHRRTLRRVLYFWILAEITDKDNFVDAFSCHGSSSNQWPMVSDRFEVSTNISA